jgi:hypothetical protein
MPIATSHFNVASRRVAYVLVGFGFGLLPSPARYRYFTSGVYFPAPFFASICPRVPGSVLGHASCATAEVQCGTKNQHKPPTSGGTPPPPTTQPTFAPVTPPPPTTSRPATTTTTTPRPLLGCRRPSQHGRTRVKPRETDSRPEPRDIPQHAPEACYYRMPLREGVTDAFRLSRLPIVQLLSLLSRILCLW